MILRTCAYNGSNPVRDDHREEYVSSSIVSNRLKCIIVYHFRSDTKLRIIISISNVWLVSTLIQDRGVIHSICISIDTP